MIFQNRSKTTLNEITKIAKNLGGIITKNSPHILTGLACTGVVSTVIVAVKKTPEAILILEDESTYRAKKHFLPLTKLEKAKLTWKCYIPAGIMGVTTIGCIIGANTVNTRRNAALASLYALSESAFREYKTKVVQEIGKNKETKIRDEVVKDHIAKNPSGDNIIVSGSGEVMCYDMLSGRYFMSSHETIRRVFNDLNYELMSEMRLDLNELYYLLNLPQIELGRMVEFNLEKGKIEPIYSTQLDTNGKPCLVIDYDVYPNFL
jgi:hypothetical protein